MANRNEGFVRFGGPDNIRRKPAAAEGEGFDPTQWVRDFAQPVGVIRGKLTFEDADEAAFKKAMDQVGIALKQRELSLPEDWSTSDKLGATFVLRSIWLGSNLAIYDKQRPMADLAKQPLTRDELALEFALKIGRTNPRGAEFVLLGWATAPHAKGGEFFGGSPGHGQFQSEKGNFLIAQLRSRLRAEEGWARNRTATK